MLIEDALQQHPREILMSGPTPLQFLPHLSQQLRLKIYLKRDDLTELALGGDKPRKLEYEIAQAKANGADTLVTCGSSQSNMARLTTAAARRTGMACSLVLSHDQWHAFQGNLLTVHLMGAQVKIVHVEDHWDLEHHALALCEQLKKEGRTPHYIPVSGTTPHSCLGYVRGGLEIVDQLAQQNIQLDAVYTPFGTGGIFTAILLTLREKDIHCPIIGISVNRRQEECVAYFDKWWNALCYLLHREANQPREPFDILDQFIGAEYGIPTEAGLEAIVQMAHSEGVLLDPVYSGKMFSGFLADCENQRWQQGQSILLIHSGGVPALFAYHAQIDAHLRRR